MSLPEGGEQWGFPGVCVEPCALPCICKCFGEINYHPGKSKVKKTTKSCKRIQQTWGGTKVTAVTVARCDMRVACQLWGVIWTGRKTLCCRDTEVRSTLVIGTQQRYCDWRRFSEIIDFSNRQMLLETEGKEKKKKYCAIYKHPVLLYLGCYVQFWSPNFKKGHGTTEEEQEFHKRH